MLEKRKMRNLDTAPDLTVAIAGLVATTTSSGFLARWTTVAEHRTIGAYYTATAGQDSLVASCLNPSGYFAQKQTIQLLL